MGYRNYISRIKKEDLAKLLLLQDNGGISYSARHDVTERLYEIGKHYDRPEDFEILNDLSDTDTDTEYIVITKNSLKAIIKQYAKMHLNYLNKIKIPTEKLDKDNIWRRNAGYLDSCDSYIKSQIHDWKRAETFIYNLDENTDQIVNSWSYQYEIFELVRIFKSFDYDNYYLIYEGS